MPRLRAGARRPLVRGGVPRTSRWSDAARPRGWRPPAAPAARAPPRHARCRRAPPPRRERTAGAGDDHTAHGIIGLRLGQSIAAVAPHAIVESILALGAIQRQEQNTL